MEEMVIDDYHYETLHKDGNGVVISKNITFFTLGAGSSETEDNVAGSIMEEMESKAKQYCQKLEIAYVNSSGNRWVFLLFNGSPTRDDLMQMKKAYQDLYDPKMVKWRDQYHKGAQTT
jgi:hypothetical protein